MIPRLSLAIGLRRETTPSLVRSAIRQPVPTTSTAPASALRDGRSPPGGTAASLRASLALVRRVSNGRSAELVGIAEPIVGYREGRCECARRSAADLRSTGWWGFRPAVPAEGLRLFVVEHVHRCRRDRLRKRRRPREASRHGRPFPRDDDGRHREAHGDRVTPAVTAPGTERWRGRPDRRRRSIRRPPCARRAVPCRGDVGGDGEIEVGAKSRARPAGSASTGPRARLPR